MRILFVLGTSTGGVGTHVRALARDLAAEHEVTVAAPRSTLEHFAMAELPGVSVVEHPMSTRFHPRDLASIRRLRRLIAEVEPDLVHAHGFRAGLLSVLAARAGPRPATVVTWHNQASGRGVRGWVEQRMERLLARRADLTLGASEDLAERARQVGSPGAVFAPVAAPAPALVSAGEAESLREQFLTGMGPGALVGLAVGRVAPQKNYDLLIDAAARSTTAVHFLIAGAADPTLLQQLTARIAATDLRRCRISFLGPRTDVTALMAAADFYVLTSHWEARALVLQEALRAGLPLIATATGGTPALVGHAGVLIDPASPVAAAEMAAAIDALADPALRAERAKESLSRAAQLPDESEVARILTEHYAQVLARTR